MERFKRVWLNYRKKRKRMSEEINSNPPFTGGALKYAIHEDLNYGTSLRMRFEADEIRKQYHAKMYEIITGTSPFDPQNKLYLRLEKELKEYERDNYPMFYGQQNVTLTQEEKKHIEMDKRHYLTEDETTKKET